MVDFLALPCNTAHCYHSEIQKAVRIPLLNMIELSVTAVLKSNPGLRAAGILASTAVLKLKLYEQRFADKDIAFLHPDDDLQDGVMEAIRTIKTGSYELKEVEALQAAADNLVAKGAEVILIACNEASIVSGEIRSTKECFDSVQVLAEAIVQTAKGSPSEQLA